MWWLGQALVIIRVRWRLVSTVAIGCKPGQARKGAAAAIDSGAVIGLVVTFFRSNFPFLEFVPLAAPGSWLFSFKLSFLGICAVYGAEPPAVFRFAYPP